MLAFHFIIIVAHKQKRRVVLVMGYRIERWIRVPGYKQVVLSDVCLLASPLVAAPCRHQLVFVRQAEQRWRWMLPLKLNPTLKSCDTLKGEKELLSQLGYRTRALLAPKLVSCMRHSGLRQRCLHYRSIL